MTALSIGIIGGADGPTQIFVTSSGGSRTIWLLAAVLIAVGAAILLLCRNKMKATGCPTRRGTPGFSCVQ